MPCMYLAHHESESILSLITMISVFSCLSFCTEQSQGATQGSLLMSKQQGFELVSCCTGTPGPARRWQWWWPLTRQMTWPRRGSLEKLTSPLATGTSSIPLVAILLSSMTSQHLVLFAMGSINARMMVAFSATWQNKTHSKGMQWSSQRFGCAVSGQHLFCLPAHRVLLLNRQFNCFEGVAMISQVQSECCAVFYVLC